METKGRARAGCTTPWRARGAARCADDGPHPPLGRWLGAIVRSLSSKRQGLRATGRSTPKWRPRPACGRRARLREARATRYCVGEVGDDGA